MSTVTLKKNASLSTRGIKFVRGVPRDDIPYELAVELSEDKRFEVKISKEEHQQAAFRAGGKPESKQARINMIAVAMDELEQGNPDHFKSDGTPDARALTAILGWQVTKDERDAAVKHKNAPKKTAISPEAPTPDAKGDLQSGELKRGQTKADRIIAKEEAREAAARKAAEKVQGASSDEDDDDLPPMDPEDGAEGEDGEGGEGGSEEEASDLDLTGDEGSADEGGEQVTPADEQAEEDESTGGEDATGGDDSEPSDTNKKVRKGKLVLKGGGHASVDPTTAGAKDI